MNENAVLQYLIQKLLSYIPGGNLLSAFIAPGASNWLSDPASMANKLIWPGQNQSLRATAFNYMDGLRNAGYSRASKDFSDAAQLTALIEYKRMLNPNASDAELRNMAQQEAANPFSPGSVFYQLADPYGMNTALPAAQQLASTIHKRGSDFTLEGSNYARQVRDAIFNKDNGILNEIVNNPGMYGNLSATDVMQLGRELVLTTQGGFKGADGKFQADEFKTRLQTLSKSIEPWKDIFGKDIPELLNQLEALTGMSAGSLSVDVGALGHRMIGIMGATGARIQNIAAYKDALASNLIDPTMSNRSVLGAAALAGDMTLGLANLSLNTMTTQDLQTSAAKFYAGTARSKYAERFALAYAKWADDNPEGTTEQFQEILRKNMASGMSHQDALLAASGAGSLRELDIYKGSDAYLNAVQSGAGFNMTREVFINNANQDFMNRFTVNNWASLSKLSEGQRAALIQEISRDQSNVLSMSYDEMTKWVMDKTGTNTASARNIANDIRTQAMMSIGAGNVEEARSMYATYVNEQEQAKQAETMAQFSTAVSALRGPGGIRGVLQTLRDSGGKANVSDIIKGYRGGVDVIDAWMETFRDSSVDLPEGYEGVMHAGLNFALNNYADIGEGGRFEEVGSMLRSGDAKTMMQGYKIASGLEALGQGTLSKMSDAEIKYVSSILGSVERNDANFGEIARDAFIDSRLFKVHEDASSGVTSEMVKRAQLLTGGMITSKDDFIKAYIHDAVGDNATDEAKKQATEEATNIWKQMQIGDIDGIDPLQKILATIEQIPEILTQIFNFFKEQPRDNK